MFHLVGGCHMGGNKAEIMKGTLPWRVPCGMLAGCEFAFFF